MKKFLSLVLALVMTMSLVTISAGAEDFTDADDVTYNEAVDVVSAIAVMDGYADGSFNPTAGLSRGAAAKIICNMLLGPTTAAALSADTAPYKDVAVGSTYAGYIAYCAQQGIVSGYADGTFKPYDSLTGYAFMKMLLGALGYDAEIEGYVGANWSVQVAKQALGIGLDSGLEGDFVGTKALNREEAALYAFNTLKAVMVEYDSKITANVNGAEITIGNSTASPVMWATGAKNDGNMDLLGGAPDGFVQFAEQYFGKLVRTNPGDDFGRPSSKWTYKGVVIGNYAKKADVSYTKSVKLADIYNDLDMSTKDSAADLYINGVKQGTHVVAKTSDATADKLSEIDGRIGDGTIVEVFLDDDTNHVTICAMSVYAGEITKVKEATATKDAYVVVDYKAGDAANVGPNDFANHNTFDTTDFEVDEIVAFTYSDSDKSIQTITSLDSVEGTLNKIVDTKSVKLGENTTKFSEEYSIADTLVVGNTFTAYVDAEGLALYVKETEVSMDQYALVLAIEGVAHRDFANRAKLLLTDGKTKVVDLSKDYMSLGVAANDIVTFKDEDGTYKLNEIAGANYTKTTVKNGAISNKVLSGTGLATVATDNKTIFVIEDTNGEMDAYTGIKTAPTVSRANVYAYYVTDPDDALDKQIKLVYMLNAASVVSSSNDVTFIAGKSVSKLSTDSDNNTFYTYNAVVNGEITTIDIDDAVAGTLRYVSGSKTNAVINDYQTTDGIVTTIDTFYTSEGVTNPPAITGIRKYSDTEVKLNNSVYAVAKDANLFVIDGDGVITKLEDLSDIATDNNDDAYFTLYKGEITNLFIQENLG